MNQAKSVNGMTYEESQNVIAVINGKPLRELTESAKRLKSVKCKISKGVRSYTYKGKDIVNMNQSQLAAAHIEDLEKKHGSLEPEQSGHALQQLLEENEKELNNLKKALADKDKAHAATVKELTDKVQELELNAVEGPTSTPFDDVMEFTNISGQLNKKPKKISIKALKQIKLFIADEFTELESDRNIPHMVADWIVDHIYYMLNFAAKNGYNLNKVWSLVHEANMRKFPDGVCKLNEHGKIMKPEGWSSNDPEVAKEVNRQITNGSW